MTETWYIILVIVCAMPPCPGRYDPIPRATVRECARHGVLLAREHGAIGFACRPSIPTGAVPLPGAIPAGRWA